LIAKLKNWMLKLNFFTIIHEYNELRRYKPAKLPKVGNMKSMFVMSQAKSETGYVLG